MSALAEPQNKNISKFEGRRSSYFKLKNIMIHGGRRGIHAPVTHATTSACQQTLGHITTPRIVAGDEAELVGQVFGKVWVSGVVPFSLPQEESEQRAQQTYAISPT